MCVCVLIIRDLSCKEWRCAKGWEIRNCYAQEKHSVTSLFYSLVLNVWNILRRGFLDLAFIATSLGIIIDIETSKQFASVPVTSASKLSVKYSRLLSQNNLLRLLFTLCLNQICSILALCLVALKSPSAWTHRSIASRLLHRVTVFARI